MSSQSIKSLVITDPGPLDPRWIAYEAEHLTSTAPKKKKSYEGPSAVERQATYAQECRELNARMMAPGARDHHLSQGIVATQRTTTSTKDGATIPIMVYTREEDAGREPDVVLVYFHGGGLWVGEADSEELSCRRLVCGNHAVYSIGYRLMPEYFASVCLSDAYDGFEAVRRWVGAGEGGAGGPGPRIVVVGSSSGGELAALVSQMAPRGCLGGALLRCPVTCDVFSGDGYVPEALRKYHTSGTEAFITSLGGFMRRAVPRDGLARMPIEATQEELRGQPRTWIQVCTNDVLYSDGVCYGIALEEAGVEVKVDVVKGWPHTFWLPVPELERAYEADMAMLEGLKWILGA
ncbi:related to lipase 2 [Cephalotrichum gorgonifer]|uniref:Related to lipase 2 n=1 Tax=Cephalotrichum gorgonifer TaxID=2041049 RepID=A0AAE8SST8_9PEZI|nr:related to lipase 2 [Cephalotrichum gorgonifer]